MPKTNPYAATTLAHYTFDRRNPGPHNAQIESLFCGVCHSNLHTVRIEQEGTVHPMIPGYEVVGPSKPRRDRTGAMRPITG